MIVFSRRKAKYETSNSFYLRKAHLMVLIHLLHDIDPPRRELRRTMVLLQMSATKIFYKVDTQES
jgi:hypothetical protein